MIEQSLLVGETQLQACMAPLSSGPGMMRLLVPGLDHGWHQEGSLGCGGAHFESWATVASGTSEWAWSWAPSPAPALQGSLKPLHTPIPTCP